MTRVVDGAATLFGSGLLSWATAPPVTDSSAAAIAMSFIKSRRTTDTIRRPAPPNSPTTFVASHRLMFARGMLGNK
jgi:hypothetical protein